MATLTNTKIKDTYDGLLKTTDNDVIGASEKVITDGLGNASVLSIGTASASFSSDIEVNTLTIGLGSGSIATNTALGLDALFSNTSGSGNVSVGQGSMRSNTSGSTNIAVGKDALRLNTTGGINVAIGYTSLYSNTIGQNNTAVGNSSSYSNTTGLYNTALGSSALYANETSGNNTALGYFALRNNTAANNTAVGSGALADNTTGGANVAMGKDALNSNTVGSNITAIGRASMSNATSGNNNTAVGFYSLVDNQASNNVAVGDFALRYNTTGGYSTALGSNALIDNTTGGFNTAVGHNSLSSNTTGTRNTAVGKSALLLNIDGERNVALGYGAGTTKTGGDNNIYIGDEADGASTTTSNEIVIGSGATGNGSNTATYGNASITEHHFTAGQVNVSGNLAIDTNTLYVDAANNRVIVGSNTSAFDLSVIKSSDASVVAQSTSASQSAYLSSYNSDTESAIQVRSYGGSVSGTIFGNSIGGANAFWSNGDNKFLIGTIGSTPVIFGTNNSEAMRIDSSGNVGIGTSPSTPLHLAQGAANTFFTLEAYASTQGATAGINVAREQLTGSESNLSFWTNTGSALTQKMTINSSGNVGIGTSSPAVKMHINNSVSSASGPVEVLRATTTTNTTRGLAVSLFNSGGINDAGVDFNAQHTTNATLTFSTDSSERMRIDSSGNVRINSDSAAASGTKKLQFWRDGAERGRMAFDFSQSLMQLQADGYMTFLTSGENERMRITSGGDVLIGTQNTTSFGSGGSGFVSGASNRYILNQGSSITAGSTLQAYYNPNGLVGSIVISGSSTAYNTSSDYRLKENVVEMTGALDRVDALKPSRFNFIADPEKTVDGFLAHEVQAIVPEAVTGEKDAVDEEGNPIYQGIDQSKIVPLLVGAIKELSAKVAALESQLNA